MSAQKRIKPKFRQISTMVMLSEHELKFLDRKVKKDKDNLKSRSAILRYLTAYAMEHPDVLDKA